MLIPIIEPKWNQASYFFLNSNHLTQVWWLMKEKLEPCQADLLTQPDPCLILEYLVCISNILKTYFGLDGIKTRDDKKSSLNCWFCLSFNMTKKYIFYVFFSGLFYYLGFPKTQGKPWDVDYLAYALRRLCFFFWLENYLGTKNIVR